MKSAFRFLGILLVLLPVSALATLEAPDHVIYGNATLFGSTAEFGTVIEARSIPGNAVLASYRIGRLPELGNQFALRIPMDAVDPRLPGRARPGDPIRLFVGIRVAAETSVGAAGVAVRLDLDPQNMGTGPAVSIADVELLEGNSGSNPAAFAVTLNTTSADPVTLTWRTQNGTASGGASCGAAGVDYVAEDSQITVIGAGALTGELVVQVCGDTEVEPNESFSVQVTAIDGGVLANNTAVATILDDDNVPGLQVADARALEPPTGSVDLVFRPRLSRSSDVPATFSYATASTSATAGSDFIAASGTVTIPAGQLEAEIRISVLADAVVEPDEFFRLQLSSPIAVSLEQSEARGVIVDPAFDPAVTPGPETGNIPDLANPGRLALSPDGAHAYAVSDSLDSVLLFARNPMNGELAFTARYSVATAGFAAALLDGARDVTLSPDGLHLYVAARNSGAIAVLERDPSDGSLSFVQNQEDSSLQGVNALRLSADGRHLYASGGVANAVAVYGRDVLTGALSLLEAERSGVDDASDAGGVVLGLDRPSGLALSADGDQLYVAARFGNAVLTFDRVSDPTSADFGKLSFAGSQRNGLGGVQGLAGAFDLVLSPDDRHLYVIGESSNSVVLFDRSETGALSWRRMWSQSDPGIFGLDGPQGIAMAPNGREVFVVGFADSSLTVFLRALTDGGTTQSGDLTVRQTVFDGEGQVNNMQGPAAVVASHDDQYIYVSASVDNSIVQFRRVSYDFIFGGEDGGFE